MSAPYRRFSIGNIVRWSGRLWIVESFREAGTSARDGRIIAAGVHLISAQSSNTSAFPTTEWPPDEDGYDDEDGIPVPARIGQRLETVEFVADNMVEYIKARLAGVFGDFR